MSDGYKGHRDFRRWCCTIGGAALVVVTVSACAPRIQAIGNQPDPEILTEIRDGDHDQDSVIGLLGTPSTTAVFGNETWFYVSQKTETVAFFEPEIIEQSVVVVQFADDGAVSSIDQLELEDGKVVTPTERITPTLGNDLGLIQQLLGNIGRFEPGR